MKLAIRDVPGAVVIKIQGKLIGGSENSEKFRATVNSLLQEGRNNIVVNLQDTPWANSQGIGLLIGAHKSAKAAGGNLVLTHVIDKIYDILSVTRLLLIFRTFDTEYEAVDYLTECDYGVERLAVAQ